MAHFQPCSALKTICSSLPAQFPLQAPGCPPSVCSYFPGTTRGSSRLIAFYSCIFVCVRWDQIQTRFYSLQCWFKSNQNIRSLGHDWKYTYLTASRNGPVIRSQGKGYKGSWWIRITFPDESFPVPLLPDWSTRHLKIKKGNVGLTWNSDFLQSLSFKLYKNVGIPHVLCHFATQ